jgi:glycosyltransferase involved in cell wall biosynthesis
MASIMLFSSTSFAAKNFLIPHINHLAPNYHITLVCGDSDTPLDMKPQIADIYNIEVARKPSLSDLFSFFRCLVLINKVRPDLVLTLTPKMSLFALLCKFLCSKKIIVGHYFTGQVWAELSGFPRFFYKFLDKISIYFLDFSLCDGLGQKKFLLSEGVCIYTKISVLGSGSIVGVEVNSNIPLSKIKSSKKDTITLLFVGRLNKSKGIDDVLILFERLVLSGCKFKLLIVGPDEQGYNKKLKILMSKYPSQINYVGSVTDPSQYYEISDLLLLPSRREGFGSVVIEAAAFTVPAVAYNIYGLEGTIINNHTGYLINAFDLDSYFDKVKYLIGHPHEIDIVGGNAFIHASNNFSREVVTRHLKQFIDSLFLGRSLK